MLYQAGVGQQNSWMEFPAMSYYVSLLEDSLLLYCSLFLHICEGEIDS